MSEVQSTSRRARANQSAGVPAQFREDVEVPSLVDVLLRRVHVKQDSGADIVVQRAGVSFRRRG
jgi:hypothetical protein